MVKKQNTNKLTMNTATKKEVKETTLINLSTQLSIPITYMVNGKSVSFMLPPCGKQTLPTGASIITKNQNIKEI